MAQLVRPPGPPNRGIIGNFPLGSADPLGIYARWAAEYGDVFYYRVVNRHIYFLNHPDLIQQVLVTDYRKFIKGEAVRFNRVVFGNGLVINEGDSWLQQRRLIQPAFHRDRIQSYATTMVSYAERLIDTWQDAEARDVHHDMMRLTLGIVAQTLFNVRIAGDRDKISVALDTIMDLSTGARMLLPPFLRRIPTPGNLRYSRAVRRLDDIVYSLIRERRESIRVAQNPAAADLLSELLQVRDEAGDPMPEKQLRDEVMTLLLAGHETTAVSLSWIWYLLARNEHAEHKLVAELSQVLNGRTPVMSDLLNLPYTDSVVKEAMRLYPPVWGLVRNPIEDCQIGGYRVPAGASVIMSQWVIHRDPRFYDDPERFHPERWLDGRTKNAPKFSYFPFGGGPRSCVGASFATMEAALVLATIAQRFQLKLACDAPIKPIPSISLRPAEGVRMILIRR